MLNEVIRVQIASNIHIYMHMNIEDANSRGWIFNPTNLPSLCWWNGCSPHSRFSYQLLHSAFPTARYQPQFCLAAQPFSKTFKVSQQAPLRAGEPLISPWGSPWKHFYLNMTLSDRESEATWTFGDFSWYARTGWINKPTNTDKFFHCSLAYPVVAFISEIFLIKKNPKPPGQHYQEFVVGW